MAWHAGSQTRFWWRLLPPVLLVGLVVFAFGRLSDADFTTFDDSATVTHNPHFNPLTASSFARMWQRPQGGLYVPVTYSVWAALTWIARGGAVDGAMQPGVFHATSLLVHAGSSLLVWLILLRLTNKPWMSLAGAMVFALHPVQVEAVAWVSGLKDLLCGLLSLLAMWLYLRPAEAGRSPLVRAGWWLATLSLLAAMLSKPSAVVVPLVALTLDTLVVGRPLPRAFRQLWPWFALSLPVMVMTRLFQHVEYLPGVPVWGRPLIALDALAFYLLKIVVPAPLYLDYGRRPDWIWASGAPLYTWAVPTLVGAAAWFVRRRVPWLPATLLLLTIGLLPVLGLVPFMFQRFTTVADHYLYLPMFAAALAVLALLQAAAARVPARWLIAGSTAFVTVMTALTWSQASHWRNTTTLFSHTLEHNPRSFLAHDLLGRQFAQDGDPEMAAAHFSQSIDIKPDYAPAHRGLGDILLRLGQYTRDNRLIEKGLDHLSLALDLRTRSHAQEDQQESRARLVVGRLYAEIGRHDQAARQFRQVLTITPRSPEAAEARKELLRISTATTTRAATRPPSGANTPPASALRQRASAGE